MNRSIRKQLITWLIIVLSFISITRLLYGYVEAIDISNDIYDEALANSADSVAARIEMKNGIARVDLPLESLAIFRHYSPNSFYYAVFDTKGIKIASNTDLLGNEFFMPSAPEQPFFETITLQNKQFRMVRMLLQVPEVELKSAVVVVAEELSIRNNLTNRIFSGIEIAQTLMVFASVIAVLVTCNKVFAPLSFLASSIMKRSSGDLSAVSTKSVPEEVEPLVDAINSLLLRSRDQIESRDRFVANAAHQLRTPIAGLKTYSSLGIDLSTIDDFRKVMSKLDMGIDRTTHVVNQLLALAQVEEANLVATDLCAVVQEAAIDLYDFSLSKNVDLQFSPSAEPAGINADARGLGLLVSNLLENAIRYSPKDGKVSVSVNAEKDTVRLIVEDNGPGIPVSQREVVFERFYRMPGSTGDGCGLGLSIVKEVALKHNARVSIETASGGQGTRISVALPKTSVLAELQAGCPMPSS